MRFQPQIVAAETPNPRRMPVMTIFAQARDLSPLTMMLPSKTSSAQP